MMAILALLLALVGVVFFLKGWYVGFLVIYTLLTFDFFETLGVNDYSTDAMVIMVLIILGIETLLGKHPIRLHNDPIAKVIILLLTWYIIRYIGSVILHEETALYGLKVIRHDFFLLSYFVFRQIRIDNFTRYFKFLIPVVIIIGFIGLVSSFIDGFDGNVFQRKTIITLAIPLLFALLTKNLTSHFQIAIIALLFIFIAITLARGIFIAVCVSIAFYYLFIKKISAKYYILLVPLIALFFVVYSSMESSKTESGAGSVSEELAEVRDLSSYESFSGGSFILRFAMFWERGDYMINHPKELIFGAGTIHEDSPNNKFTFGIGSFKTIDDIRSKQMIDTDDVAILAHWIRYGSIYLILFIYFLKVCFKRSWNFRENRYMAPLVMLLITMCFSMLSVDSFSRANRFCIALMLLSMIFQYWSRKPKQHLEK